MVCSCGGDTRPANWLSVDKETLGKIIEADVCRKCGRVHVWRLISGREYKAKHATLYRPDAFLPVAG